MTRPAGLGVVAQAGIVFARDSGEGNAMAWLDSRRSILLPGITYERLAAWRKRLIETADVGKMDAWWAGDDGPTFPEMVAKLLDMLASRRTRRKRYTARRRLAQLDWRPEIATPAAE